MREVLRVGTRGSALALSQARAVLRRLARKNPGCRFVIVPIRTLGDEYQSVALFKKNKIGVFTKEIEKQLLTARIDIAVHSLKDLPTKLHRNLRIAACPKRASVQDALISRGAWTLDTLPYGAAVGTGSPRRKAQLRIRRPDLRLVDLRGNLDTRVRKVLQEKKLDAIVIAAAGIERLGRFRRNMRKIPAASLLPAVGQGALALQVRSRDARSFVAAKKINHAGTESAARAERAFLKALRGGCRVPVGVLSRIRAGKIFLHGGVYSLRTDESAYGKIDASSRRPESAGKKLARLLLKQGAGRFMKEARSGG